MVAKAETSKRMILWLNPKESRVVNISLYGLYGGDTMCLYAFEVEASIINEYGILYGVVTAKDAWDAADKIIDMINEHESHKINVPINDIDNYYTLTHLCDLPDEYNVSYISDYFE